MDTRPPGDDTEQMLRQSARAFLAGQAPLRRARTMAKRPDGFDRAAWQAIAELGWLGLRLPEALGGAGLGARHAGALAEEMGAALIPEPFVAAALQPAILLAHAPASTLRAALAADLLTGRRLIAFAGQESVNPNSAECDATLFSRCGATLTLSGGKLFVPGAADTLLVSGRLDGDVVVGVCAADAAGVSRAAMRLSDGTLTVTLRFADVALADDAVLLRGTAAERALAQAYDEALVVTAAYLAGLAAAALEATLSYLRQRVQFGQPIGKFQALQHRCIDLYLETQLAGASWRQGAARCEAGAASVMAARAAKARCSDAALLVTRSAIQLHGAIGYTAEADIGLYLKAALRHAASFGNAVAHRRRFLDEMERSGDD